MQKRNNKQKAITRKSFISRITRETSIEIELCLDGKGKNNIKTGIAFLDHMLCLFSRHGNFDLKVKAKGDLEVDIHHTNEDIAITLGKAFKEALGNKSGIRRYGFFYVPMDEALVRVVLDISNRPEVYMEGLKKSHKTVKQYSFNDCRHFMKSFATACGLNLHINILSGEDRHHIMEAIFKALARAMAMAVEIDKNNMSIPSTKGIL